MLFIFPTYTIFCQIQDRVVYSTERAGNAPNQRLLKPKPPCTVNQYAMQSQRVRKKTSFCEVH